MARILDFFYKLQETRKKQKQKRKQPYIYRLDIIERRTIKRYLKYRFVSLRLVKLFYINYNYKKFRVLSNRMRKKVGMFEWNFLLQVEGRLMSFIYRTSLVANLFQCMQLIKQGHVYVNFKNFPYVNHTVQVGDFLTFTSLGKKLIYLMLIKRLSKKITLFNAPGYMYVSYALLYAYMKRPPLKKQLVFPIAIDLYRATGYAF
jgi:ribosomal protein S4